MSRRAAVPALALVLLAAAPASAHTALSGSVPADGATTSAPERVVLSFSGEVLEGLSAVTVVGPDGADAAQGDPRLQGTDVVQPLDGPLDPGRWTVSYRVVAADGHPLTGQLGFTVEGASTSSASTSSAPASSAPAVPPPVEDAEAAEDGTPTALVGGLVAGGLAAAALGLLVLRRRGSGG